MSYGPQLPFSDALHAEKYRGAGETFSESMSRVASALTADGEEFQRLRSILLDQRFLPAGRIQAAVGAPKRVTPYNCFVSGRIEDSFVEGSGSIMDRAKEAATTMRMGGGIGYDFSTLRPRGALIRKLNSHSSGPLEFMNVFDAICKCVASSGHRRGAQMGVLRVDHPDIEEFICAKHNSTRLTGFNLSVAVTDEFMQCVEEGREFELRFDRVAYRKVDARALWDLIMRSTYDWAEPGVLFIDRINEMNNLFYCETISATNPCGEQPLPPHGACLLGSFNLVKYLLWTDLGGELNPPGVGRPTSLDYSQLGADVYAVVRAMDRVVDVATYPLDEQREEAQAKRRMGLGVTGVANALEALGYPYGSNEFCLVLSNVLSMLRDCAYEASSDLAVERGPFPCFRADHYLQSGFAKTLPEALRRKIGRQGMRNSHLLSIAPTGTISLCADNVSSGIEPVFAHEIRRRVITGGREQVVTVPDYGVSAFGIYGKTSAMVSVDEHLAVLETASRYVDSAVSKTCNVPAEIAWDEFKALYTRAWRAGAKGCTTYRTGGKREGILEATGACSVDAETGERSCE